MSRYDKIKLRWECIKSENPGLMQEIYRLAHKAKYMRGYKRWSMDGLFHVLRWETALRTGGPLLKINNDFTALAARDLIDEHPEFEGFFQLRARKARGAFGRIDEPVEAAHV